MKKKYFEWLYLYFQFKAKEDRLDRTTQETLRKCGIHLVSDLKKPVLNDSAVSKRPYSPKEERPSQPILPVKREREFVDPIPPKPAAPVASVRPSTMKVEDIARINRESAAKRPTTKILTPEEVARIGHKPISRSRSKSRRRNGP